MLLLPSKGNRVVESAGVERAVAMEASGLVGVGRGLRDGTFSGVRPRRLDDLLG